MKNIFDKGSELKYIFEETRWGLYDTIQSEGQTIPFTFETLEEKGLTNKFEIEHNYLFAPIPKKGQTLREAYTPTKGFGPSLLIKDLLDERWAELYLVTSNFERGLPILFTRLVFEEEYLVACTPKTRDLPKSDIVAIKYPYIIDTFKKFFRIVSPEEYGIVTPIPMPFHPEDN